MRTIEFGVGMLLALVLIATVYQAISVQAKRSEHRPVELATCYDAPSTGFDK